MWAAQDVGQGDVDAPGEYLIERPNIGCRKSQVPASPGTRGHPTRDSIRTPQKIIGGGDFPSLKQVPDQAGADDLALPDGRRHRMDSKIQLFAKATEVLDIPLTRLPEAEVFSDHHCLCLQAGDYDPPGKLGRREAGESPVEGGYDEGAGTGSPDCGE